MATMKIDKFRDNNQNIICQIYNATNYNFKKLHI